MSLLRRWIVATLLASGTAMSTGANAQASLAAENIIDSIVFQYQDATGSLQKVDVTVVRDAREANQWYYVPSSPVLVSTNVGSSAVPVFSLLQYDYRDSTNAQTIKREGLLNFAVRLSLPPEATAALKNALVLEVRKRQGQISSDNVRIAALPIISATVSLFANDGNLVGTAEGTGVAPTFASQHMAFSVPLTEVGAPVFDALVRTPTGIRTAVQYKYYGLTPPAGFKVKLNYRNAFEHYSKNEQFRARASYYGLFSASVASERTSIREELIRSGAMQVEIIDSANFSMEKVDAYLQPILKRINDQVLENQRPPDKIDPARASPGSTGGYFGGASYSVAMKSVSSISALTEEIDFRQQSIVERATVASGFIGIGNYPESIKSQLFTAVDGAAQRSAYLAFPEVPRGLARVDLSVALQARGETFAQRTYVYKRDSGWKDLASGKDADRIGFSLASVEQKYGASAPNEGKFQITKVIRSGEDAVSVVESIPTNVATQAVDLESSISGIRLRPSQVVFAQMGGDVRRVVARVITAGKKKEYVFEAVNANGTWQAPFDEFFLLPQSEEGKKGEVQVETVLSSGQTKTNSTSITLQRGFSNVFLDAYR